MESRELKEENKAKIVHNTQASELQLVGQQFHAEYRTEQTKPPSSSKPKGVVKRML